jgi:glycosyltransferase involved in cell wall biosynthesis
MQVPVRPGELTVVEAEFDLDSGWDEDNVAFTISLAPIRMQAAASGDTSIEVVEGIRRQDGSFIPAEGGNRVSVRLVPPDVSRSLRGVSCSITEGAVKGAWVISGASTKLHPAAGPEIVMFDPSIGAFDAIQVDAVASTGRQMVLSNLKLVWETPDVLVPTTQQCDVPPMPAPLKAPAPRRGDGPLVSVIIPSYNRRHSLHSTLASVFAQTEQDFEVIVIDDASTDNTRGETLWYRENFPDRFRYLELSHNQGESYARNRAVEQANGYYLAFLDSDDQWAPTYLSRMIEALETPGLDLVWCFVDFFSVTDDGNLSPESYSWINQPGVIRNPNHGRIWLGPQHCVYRRSAFLGYNETIDKAEDADLYERMLTHNYRFGCVPENLVSVIHHRDSQNRAGEWSKDERWKRRQATRGETVVIDRSGRATMASLVMLAWDRLPMVRETLQNLMGTIDGRQTPYELIIIDNGSADGTTEWLDGKYEELTRLGHKIILNGWNAGIPLALNQGLLLREGDIFVHAASDIHMEEGWLNVLFDAFNRYPSLGVSGVLYDGIPPEILVDDGRYPGLLFPPSDAAIGPALSFPMDVYRRLGAFNTELGKYGREDTLYCRRARAAGYKVAYVHGTRAHHHGEELSPTGRTQEARKKQDALAATRAYAVHYSARLSEGDPAYITRSFNDLFLHSGCPTPAGLPYACMPPVVTLCFTLRHPDLRMVEKAVDSCIDHDIPVDVVFVCNNAEASVVDWALAKRRRLMQQGILVHVINYRGNWGIAKAYNAALAASWAPFIATLNDDIEAEPGWLLPMLKAAGRPDTGYVASILSQHRAYLSGDFRVGKTTQIARLGVPTRQVDPRQFVGFAGVLQRTKLADVGPFDTSTFVYHAETDMAARLAARGYLPHEVDSAVLHHRAASTRFAERSLRNLADRYTPQSLLYLR